MEAPLKTFRLRIVGCLAAAFITLVPTLHAQRGGNANQGPDIQITVNGQTYGQRALFQRNVGTPEDQTTQFPPHKIIGNCGIRVNA